MEPPPCFVWRSLWPQSKRNSQTGRQLKRAPPQNTWQWAHRGWSLLCPPSYWRSSPRLLHRRWDVSREPLAGSSARVDRRHRSDDIEENSLPFLQQSTSRSCRTGQKDNLVSTPNRALLSGSWSFCFSPSVTRHRGPLLDHPRHTPVLSATPTLRLPSMLPYLYIPAQLIFHIWHWWPVASLLPNFPPSTSSYLPPTLSIIAPPTINTYFRVNLQQPTPTTTGGLALLLALTVVLLVSVLSNSLTWRHNSSTSN